MALTFPIKKLNQTMGLPIVKYINHVRAKILRPRLTVLSVSLLNGHFKAMSMINDSIHRTWEHSGVIIQPEALRQALLDAIHHTQFTGTQISILCDSKRFITQTLQLPPMPYTDLLPILERKAQAIKKWDGPAGWRYHLGIQAKGKQTVHLEIWPQDFINEIILICEELGLQLQQLAPLSALSESQLGILPVGPGEATLLITVLEGKVMFVAGKDDGSPLIIRHLAPAQDWVPLGERVGTEINRTIMFINQQTNLNIPQVWFLGEDTRLTIEEVQPYISTPILPCPISPDWKYWLWVGATLPIKHDTNFTPPHVLRASRKKLTTHAVAAGLAGLLILGVGTTGILEGYLAKNREGLHTLAQRVNALRDEQQQLQGQLVTLQNKRKWIQTVTATRPPFLQGPFLSYLGSILPQQTIIQKASIIRRNTSWDVELIGSIRANLSESLSVLETFIKQLAGSPYFVTVQEDWRDQLLTQTVTSTSPTKKTTNTQYRFTLKGHMS